MDKSMMITMPRAVMFERALDPNFIGPEDEGILAAICDWVEQCTVKIDSAHALGAGWEKWAQVELALHINQRLGGKYATLRADVYQAYAFADIVVFNGTGKLVHVMELKCRGPNASEADFIADLGSDHFKLTQNAMATPYNQARKWVIGINVGPVIAKGLGWVWHKHLVAHSPFQVYYRCFV